MIVYISMSYACKLSARHCCATRKFVPEVAADVAGAAPAFLNAPKLLLPSLRDFSTSSWASRRQSAGDGQTAAQAARHRGFFLAQSCEFRPCSRRVISYRAVSRVYQVATSLRLSTVAALPVRSRQRTRRPTSCTMFPLPLQSAGCSPTPFTPLSTLPRLPPACGSSWWQTAWAAAAGTHSSHGWRARSRKGRCSLLRQRFRAIPTTSSGQQ